MRASCLRAARDGINHAGELGEEAVAGVLYDPAPVPRNRRINQLAEVGLELFVRTLLIRAHQTRVPGHVGGEYRGEAADRGHRVSEVVSLNQDYPQRRGDPSPIEGSDCAGGAREPERTKAVGK